MIIRLVFIAVLGLFTLFEARAQTAPMEVIPPGKARSQFLQMWDSSRLHLEKGEFAEAKKYLQFALESKWDGALGDLPVPATALIRQAQNLNAEGELEAAAWLIQMAERLAPGSVYLHLSLSRYYLGGGPFSPGKSLSHYLQAFSVLHDDFPALYRVLGRASIYFLVFTGLFGLAFGLIMIARYGPLLLHDFKDLFGPGKVPDPMIYALNGLLLLLPLGAGLSFWWVLSWWFFIFSLYMNRSERVWAYLWFLALAGSPWLIDRYSVFCATRSDEVLQTVLRVRNGVPLPNDPEVMKQALKKDPDNPLVRYTNAQLLTRRGQSFFRKAVSMYEPIKDDPLTAQGAYNNLAEIYMAAGDLVSVSTALSAAMEKGPARVEIVYNLARYYNESEQLVHMEEQFKAARSIDGERLDEYLERSGPRRLNRAMASLPVPWELVWQRSVRGSALANVSGTGQWKKWMGAPEGIWFLGACAGGLVLILLLQILGMRWRRSVRCESCGKPICLRCQRPSKDPAVCSPCFHVFRGEGGVELKVKMQKRQEVQRYRDLRARLGMVVSLVVPGSGLVLLGRTGVGVLLLAFSGLIWSGVVSGLVMWPRPGPIYTGGIFGHVIMLALAYVILMVISALVFRSQSENWR